jgi:muramidase (phage lysozyme)
MVLEPLGYNSQYGGGTFTDKSYAEAPADYAKHPGKKINEVGADLYSGRCIPVSVNSGTSLSVTSMDIPDFSPHSQDLAAIALIKENRAL